MSVPAAELTRPPGMKPATIASKNRCSQYARSSGFSTSARPRATRRRTSSAVFSSALAYFSSSTSRQIACSSSSVAAWSSFIHGSLIERPHYRNARPDGPPKPRFEADLSILAAVNLQQFRYLREAVRQKLNLTAAAKTLHTSQPGVSKAIIELEEELGLSVFARHGKRILGLTPPGQQVLDAAERIMTEIDNLKKLARDYAGSPEGTLRLATTHTQARYVLPPVVQR